MPAFVKNVRKEDPEEVIASEKGAVVQKIYRTKKTTKKAQRIPKFRHKCGL
jgi:hypothetical protein